MITEISKYPYLLLIFLFTGFSGYSQTAVITGKLTDAADNTPLMFASVSLTNATDSTKRYYTNTKEDGSFSFSMIPHDLYFLEAAYFGYQSLFQAIQLDKDTIDIGSVSLSQTTTTLQTQVLKGRRPPSIQKGDTTELNASSFKTNPNANAEDLLQKMPGVTMDGGSLKVQGENVTQVLVDGKPFFGEDPAAALKNLPADVISKIQVFDKMSDQSAFTGFDDGNATKTINIITKEGIQDGKFGNVLVGYGTDNRYIGSGNINFFNEDRRLSILGLSNNINQQNFSTDDLSGVAAGSASGGGGRRGGGRGGFGRNNNANNFLIGQQNGIATTHALGVNYTDTWGKKVEFSGSYFLNDSENENLQTLRRSYFQTGETNQEYNESNSGIRANLNHRGDFRIEYTIDSSNSIIISPEFSIQKNNSESIFDGTSIFNSIPVSRTNSIYNTFSSAYQLENSILFRHKFKKPKRTLSLRVEYEGRENDIESSLNSTTTELADTSGISQYQINQNTERAEQNTTWETRLIYTEPIKKDHLLQFSYKHENTSSNSEKRTYSSDFLTSGNEILNPSLSSIFENFNMYNRLGAAYKYSTKPINLSIGGDFQRADLSGEQTFPTTYSIDKTFYSFLPNAMLRLNSEKGRNFRLYYRSSTNLPSANQLQDVIDNSNPILLSIGNPSLRQELRHNLVLRYNRSNTEKATSFFAYVRGSAARNYIGSSFFVAQKDTLLPEGYLMVQGAQLSRPENLSGYYSLNSFATYGFSLDSLKLKINMNLGYSYSRIPGIANNIRNFANTNSANLGVVVASNISEKVDFTVSSTSNYTTVSNTGRTDQNNNFFSQNSSVKLKLILPKDFVFYQDLNHYYFKGLGSQFNTNYLLYNLSAGKRIFKKKNGEIKISIFDLFNQNNNVSRTVTETFIEDSQSLVLKRYYMITFLYNIRSFKSSTPPSKSID